MFSSRPLTSFEVFPRVSRVALILLLLSTLVACGGSGASLRVPLAASETPASVAVSSGPTELSSSDSSSFFPVQPIQSSSQNSSVKASLRASSSKVSSSKAPSSSSTIGVGYLSVSSATLSIGGPIFASINSSSASSLEAIPLPDCPGDQYRSEFGECIIPEHPSPTYRPAADEVVIYFNAADKQFDGYTLYLWQDCGNGWADEQSDGINNLQVPHEWYQGLQASNGAVGSNRYFSPGLDPIYGAYFVLKINPAGTCGNFILRSPGRADVTKDLQINTTSTDSPYDRMFFIIKQGASLTDAIVSKTPICINDLCIPYEDSVFDGSASSTSSVSSSSAVAISNTYRSPSTFVEQGNKLYMTDYFAHRVIILNLDTSETTVLAGSVSTVGSDDGLGTAASFYYPSGIASDGTHLYVTDAGNHNIRKIEIASGEVSTLAGSGYVGNSDGSGASASFFSPQGITLGGDNLYVSDTGNNSIRKIAMGSGAVSTLTGLKFADNLGFNNPVGIAFDAGNLYIADSFNHTLRKLNIVTGAVTQFAGSPSRSESVDGIGVAAGFASPQGVSSNGSFLYVSDASNTLLRLVDIATAVVTTHTVPTGNQD